MNLMIMVFRRPARCMHAVLIVLATMAVGDAAAQSAVKGVPNSVMLAKPFAPAQLVTALAQLLNAAPPVAPET